MPHASLAGGVSFRPATGTWLPPRPDITECPKAHANEPRGSTMTSSTNGNARGARAPGLKSGARAGANAAVRRTLAEPILRQIDEEATDPGLTNAVLLVQNLLIWIGAAILATRTAVAAPIALIPVILLAANLLIGSRLVAIANLLHQASHKCLFSNLRLNNRVGQVTAVLTFTTSCRYCDEHRIHHAHLGDLDDPKLQTYRHAGLAPLTKTKPDVVIEHLVLPLLGKGVGTWLKNAIKLRPEEDKGEFALLWLFWLAATLISAFAGVLLPFVAFALLPQALGKRAIRGFLDVINHAGIIEQETPLTQSRNFTATPVVGFLLGGEPLLNGLSDDFLHGVHHPLHRVPQHMQATAHQILMGDPEYSAHNTPCTGVFRTPKGAPTPCALDHLIDQHR